jgi:hypothetical protein
MAILAYSITNLCKDPKTRQHCNLHNYKIIRYDINHERRLLFDDFLLKSSYLSSYCKHRMQKQISSGKFDFQNDDEWKREQYRY